MRGVGFVRRAVKELRRIPLPDRDRIMDRVSAFVENPTSPQHDVKGLARSKALRLRVGDYRVVLRPAPGGQFVVERVGPSATGLPMSASRNSISQQIEDLEDERDDYAAMLARVESANEDVIPLSIIKRLSDGESPVSVWRDYRGLSEKELSDRSGVGPLTILAIEKAGADILPLSSYAAIARALDIDLDMLVPWTPGGEPESD